MHAASDAVSVDEIHDRTMGDVVSPAGAPSRNSLCPYVVGAFDCVDLLRRSGQAYDASVSTFETGDEAVHRGHGVALRIDGDERDFDRSFSVKTPSQMHELGKRGGTRVQAVREAERQYDGVPALGR